MIHVFHTSAAELARSRERLARRCLVVVVLPGLALCCWALATPVLEFRSECTCNFTGVAFIPEEEADEVSPLQLRFEAPPPDPQAPAELADALPEFISPQAEVLYMDEVEEESSADELDTPSDALLAAGDAESASSSPPKEKKMSASTSDSGTYTPPAYLVCPHPPYPPHLRQRRVCGTVGLIIAVSAEGEPTEVTIAATSGHTPPN